MQEEQKDGVETVVSSTECTGILPAIPWDADTENARRLYRVHRQPRTEYHRVKD